MCNHEHGNLCSNLYTVGSTHTEYTDKFTVYCSSLDFVDYVPSHNIRSAMPQSIPFSAIVSILSWFLRLTKKQTMF